MLGAKAAVTLTSIDRSYIIGFNRPDFDVVIRSPYRLSNLAMFLLRWSESNVYPISWWLLVP